MLVNTLDSVMNIIYAIVFVLGSLFGSFFNVCMYRIPRVHFRLTAQALDDMRHNRHQAKAMSFAARYLVRPMLTILHALALHPGPVAGPIPADVVERLAPMQDQDYVTLNDFGDALDAQLGENEAETYGDAVLQYATQHPESIAFPGSHCPHCQTPIKPWDNLPILSFLLLRGRCRSCHAAISWRYPFVELLTALLFVGLVAQFGLTPETLVYLIFVSLLVIISGIDFDHQLIPDILSVPGILLGLALVPLSPIQWPDAVLGMLAGGGIIWITGFLGALVFKKEAMGGGDVKLMAMIGAFLGWKMVLLTIFFGSLAGAIIGIVFKLVTGKEYIPFGPFLSIGALAALLIGQRVLMWYGGYWNQLLFP